MKKSKGSCSEYLVMALLSTTLAACGGGGSAPIASYTVGGVVVGLSGSGLILQNNGGDDVAVSAPGTFTFAKGVKNGGTYSVTVATQPSAPTQNCVVTNGLGTVRGANVTNVGVACTIVPFTVLANQPPEIGYLSLLLTDGSVMMQSVNDASVFYDLMPAADGGYVNGTWRRLASPPMGYAPADGSRLYWRTGACCSSAANTIRTSTNCLSRPAD